jgi:malonyl-CoA reductase/3-hydroxypropionate dehydrogenase (NADP+)
MGRNAKERQTPEAGELATGVAPPAPRKSAQPPILAGRLADKVAVITGAGGILGEAVAQRYLEEGAIVVMVGRTGERLEEARKRLTKKVPGATGRIVLQPFDAADPGQVRLSVGAIVEKVGRIDILVNGAGTPGPKQRLERVPVTREELEALAKEGSSENETVREAASNVLGVPWNMVRACAPHMPPGSSVVNISTIFSRTRYFGRAAYVVPKAALNAFSRQLAFQLGERGIRVNTVYPGPVESERIRSVFDEMDKLRNENPGATANDFLSLMALSRAEEGKPPERAFPSIEDVAHTVVFLGSDESRAFTGHGFEVTNGMKVGQESRSSWVSRPEMRTLDGTGVTVLVAAGDQVADALEVARVQSSCGAAVVLGMGSEESVQAAQAALDPEDGWDRLIQPVLFDRRRPETLDAVLGDPARSAAPILGAIILPAFGPWRFRDKLAEASDTDVDTFLGVELCGAIVVARALASYWKTAAHAGSEPHAVFLSNGDDGAENAYANLLRAGIEELVRVWRDESEQQCAGGERNAAEWSNQIIRWSSSEEVALKFAASQAARLLFSRRRIPQVSLYVPASIVESTGSPKPTFGWIESLMGLHLGKVALITGGSAGIGGQLGRLLAIAGARVMLTARREDQLRDIRESIVAELEEIGYYRARERVRTLADIDVGDEAALVKAMDATLKAFGRIDFLVNNAGVAGAEQMVVDMDPEVWRATQRANLISNYSLIEKVVPLMKKQGSGYILNVSSYFGGEKYIAVPYPNRSDYAVSKAGQRALVENIARFVGPEIQINAIAPGPVEGQRLKGKDGKAGLFMRRARLILENKRLNLLHGAVLRSLAEGASLDDVLGALATNDLGLLSREGVPAPLRAFAAKAGAEADGVERDEETEAPTYSALRYVMTASIATRLIMRLRNGCVLLDEDGVRRADAWREALPAAPEPFVDPAAVLEEAERIRTGVLGMIHLHNMPTETDVALATVFFMADRAISGETFEPSGGLHQERTITERELFGRARPERVRRMEGETIWMIGEHLTEPLAAAARLFLAEGHVGSVMMLTRTAAAGEAIRAALGRALGHDRVSYHTIGDDIEQGLDAAYKQGGKPAAVISSPFTPLPKSLFGGEGVDKMDAVGFEELVEGNLTHHFRVARKASLFKGARLILVSPDVPVGGTLAQFAMANFVKTTLHAFTATLGVENERLFTHVPVNQVNLTRRMRSEEPRDAAEQAEEYDRFAHAALLAAAPIAEAGESRYRARIYRGLAITV